MNELNQPTKGLAVGNVLGNAWELTEGSKWPIWAVNIVIILLAVLLNIVLVVVFKINFRAHSYWKNFIILPIITNILIAPYYAGSIMVAVKHARKEVIMSSTGFKYLHRYIPVAITLVIVSLITSLATIIVKFPAIAPTTNLHKDAWDLATTAWWLIVSPFLFLSIPLVVDKNYSPWQALKNSMSISTPYWHKIFLIRLVGYFFVFLAFIPVFIGLIFKHLLLITLGSVITFIALIWIVPFFYMLHGIIYSRLVDQNYPAKLE